MDRLVKADLKEVNLVYTKGQKCSATFKLTNLMHTMSVAVSLTTTNPSRLSISQPLSIIPPLRTISFTLLFSQPSDSDHPPLSTPPDTILVRSSMLPTGKANQEDLRRLFSKPGPHIFKDATIPISLVGPQVVEFLISSSSKTLEIAFLLSQAISWCNKSQLTSLLRSAAMRGNSYFVSALIDAGADVNNRESDSGDSIISMAIQSGNLDVVQLLIESGSLIDNSVDRFLHDAAAMNRLDLMEVLCLAYLDIEVNSFDSCGQTPLHIAAVKGHRDIIQFLLSLGSNPDIADCNKWTPLHYASIEGHVEAVELLLNSSTFGKYAVTKEGKTAFSLAVEKGHSNLYDILHLGDVLQRAARIDDVNGIKNCLAEGSKVNGRDQYGWTPLHRAAFKGRIESVKMLLKHGAQVDGVDDFGYTPLHRAVEGGHLQVAMCLLGHGARANLKSLVGVVPFDLSVFKNHSSPVTSYVKKEMKYGY